MSSIKVFLALGLFVTASVVDAQQRPPIRQLGPITAKSTEVLGNIAALRELPGGKVLVNDMPNRRLLMFDPTLGSFTVVADSTSATGNAYSGRFAGLIGYKGDSSIFVDPVSLSMLVIDPNGKVGRVMSVPRSQDAMMLAVGGATVDPAGRLIYRAPPSFRMPPINPNGSIGMPDMPDSAAIVRIDLASRKIDTVGFIKTPKLKFDINRDDNGGMRVTTQINPLPTVDDWTALPGGAVAFVRGRDYHIDFVNPDGTKTSAAKIPFDWQRLTDEDKVAFIDSLKAARERLGANAPTVGLAGSGPQVMVFSGPAPTGAAGRAGGAPAPGGTRDGGGPGNIPNNVRIQGPSGPAANVQMNFIPASELPDYKPPFFSGSVRADTEGNLWIRTIPTKAIPGGPVYDVINRKGELVERVQIPENRLIVGFGANGAVYLAGRDSTVLHLEKAQLK